MFVLGKPFQPSLMFVSEVGSGRSNTLTLPQTVVNYSCKKFYIIGPGLTRNNKRKSDWTRINKLKYIFGLSV